MIRQRLFGFCACVLLSIQPSFAAELDQQLKALRSVGPKGAGHKQAMVAWKQVAALDAQQLPAVLAGMDDCGILASNWIRSAAETIADRQLKSGKSLPQDKLEAFVKNTSHSPRARRLAFEILARVDDTARERIIPKLNRDSSMELRRDAIGMAMDRAGALQKAGDNDAASEAYQTAFIDARDVDQIKAIAAKLKELSVEVDLTSHFGFITQWSLVAPFDNKDKKGFDVAYPPEHKIDLKDEYAGVDGKVNWRQHTTKDPYGVVDINKAIGKHMGAVCYAYTEFHSSSNRECHIRIGCTNGNKVWLNGKLITSNHVYHTGMAIDQYIANARLKKGKNQILVKVCQNEQTDNWAQNWQFQLRVCDALGTSILDSRGRTPRAARLQPAAAKSTPFAIR